MLPTRSDLLTCILVVTAAVLIGVAKCATCAHRLP
jgi:hypothetical protein